MVAAEGKIRVDGTELNASAASSSPTAPAGCGRGSLSGGRWWRRGARGIARREAVRLRQGSDQLDAKGRFAGIVQTGLQADSRIVGRGARIRVNLRRRRVRRGL